MSATGYLDACGWIPTSGGTGNWTVSSAITGYRTLAVAQTAQGYPDGTVYSYRGESADKTQWEEGYGASGSSGTTLARTVTASSNSGSLVNFSAAPNVYIVAASADLQNASLLTSGTLPNARLTAGQFPGTATNDSASAGNIGEYVASSVASGSAVALISGTTANVTSISLAAGDWDVSAVGILSGGVSTTLNRADFSVSTTSATLNPSPGNEGTIVPGGTAVFGYDNPTITVGPVRFSLASTTTIYLAAQAAFGTSTCSAYGILRARRMR